MDRWISVALGRPLALHDDEYGFDIPLLAMLLICCLSKS